MLPGHVLLDHHGAIVQADDGFGALLMTPAARLRGCDVLSITAPADREECCEAIAALKATGKPFDIVKRFIRQDDTVLWVRNSVSRMLVQQQDLIVATCTPVLEPIARHAPGDLLHTAQVQVQMVEAQSSICHPFPLAGPSWPALLQVYIAEAEGRIMDIDMLAASLGQSRTLINRYVTALVGSGVLEVETRSLDPDVAKAYRLTTGAVHRLEDYLLKFAVPVTR
jgi:hypothetical protein